MKNIKRAFISFMIAVLILLSYRPIQEELIDLSNNATLTNALIDFMASYFQYVWILLAIFTFAVSIYFISLDLSR